MQVSQTQDELRVSAVRSQHIPGLIVSTSVVLVAAYAVGQLARSLNAEYGVNEGVIPLLVVVYLLLPLAVRQLQPSRFSPLFQLTVWPAVALLQAAFTVYRQSSIVCLGDEYVFDRQKCELEHNGEPAAQLASIEAVEVYRNTFPTIGDTFSIKLLVDGEQMDVGYAVRSAREGRMIGARIATFLGVPFADEGDEREPAETIGHANADLSDDVIWSDDEDDEDREDDG